MNTVSDNTYIVSKPLSREEVDALNTGMLLKKLGIDCPKCKTALNSWDQRAAKALGYQAIVCERCMCAEYGCDIDYFRATLEHHFGLRPCLGI